MSEQWDRNARQQLYILIDRTSKTSWSFTGSFQKTKKELQKKSKIPGSQKWNHHSGSTPKHIYTRQYELRDSDAAISVDFILKQMHSSKRNHMTDQ